MEKRVSINPNSNFFMNVYLPVIKQVKHPKNEAIVVVVNKERSDKLKTVIKDKYKFVFDYIEGNDETVGIEVFHLGEE